MNPKPPPAANTTAYFEQGLAAQDFKQTAIAIKAYLKVIQLDPQHFAATYNLATLYHDSNQLESACQAYIEAIRINPASALAYKGLGDIFLTQQKFDEALLIYHQAVKIEADFAEVWHNIGLAEKCRNHPPAALKAYQQAILLQPNYQSALTGLIELSRATGTIDETINFLNKLSKADPRNTALKLTLAEIFYNHNQHNKALSLIHDTLLIDKNNAEAFNLLGLINLQQGEAVTARGNFCKACDLKPDSIKISSNQLYSFLTDPTTTAKTYMQTAKLWWRRQGAPLSAAAIRNHNRSLNPRRRLRLGFLSGDFKRHSVSYFFLPLISNLSKETFIIYCYSDTWKTDEYTKEIEKQADYWRSTYGLDDLIVCKLIEEDRIDILVELSGHTANNRLAVIARQPAPVQFSWLGYPASTGITNNTFRLTDNLSDPRGCEKNYTETLTYIKAPFLCYEPPPEARNLPTKMPQESKKKIVFASFNNATKINQEVVNTWSKILIKLPESTIIFKTRTLKDKSAAANLRKRFSRNQITPQRILIYSDNFTSADHFLAYNQVDIALDPFPYNGTTTTCDALWMGIPVISLRGKTHAARVGATLLQTINCPELIADSKTEYVNKAINLAQDSKQLQNYHHNIRSLMQNSPLMDAAEFALNFSQALQNRWREWHSQRLKILQRLVQEQGKLLALPPELSKLIPENDTALILLEKSIKNNHDLHLFIKLGQKYVNEQMPAEARSCFEYAVAGTPDNPTAHFSLAHTLENLNREDEALCHYRKTLALDPHLYSAAVNASRILAKQNDSESALKLLLDAHKSAPDDSDINFQLANIYYDLQRLEEAYASLCRCLKFKPKQAGIWNNLGYLMGESGKSDKAAECYRQALSINPNLIESQTNLIWYLAQNYLWPELNKRQQACTVLPPLMSIILEPKPQANLKCARKVLQKMTKETSIMSQSNSINKRKATIIKIGYLSCDFRDHPVAHNLLNLFRFHNRNNFQITAYSCGRDDDSVYRQQISRDCDRFVDLQNLNDLESAKRIHSDGIDILVELMGHTRDNRLGICAFRPAPVQVSYLGYPGTTGAEFIDYLIADKIIIPPEDKIHYSEEIIYLPDCFMIADRAPIGSLPKRSECGLPETGFIFCSFNSPFKIEPVMFKVWMDILTAVPDSYLWLRSGSERFETNLKNEAKKFRVNPEHLIFAARVGRKEDHLARLQLADLALDTRIYNGHTTTLDALWAGVPVLTTRGSHFASRVSDSNLLAISLDEMIVKDLKTYKKTAVELAQHPDKLENIKKKLKHNRLTMPLFDTQKTVINLESAFLKIWKSKLQN